jgi:hypothetical protein
VLIVGCQFHVRGGAPCGQLRRFRDDIERSGAQAVCLSHCSESKLQRESALKGGRAPGTSGEAKTVTLAYSVSVNKLSKLPSVVRLGANNRHVAG